MYGEKAYYRFLDGEHSSLIHDYSGEYNNATWEGTGFFDHGTMRCVKVDIKHELFGDAEAKFGFFLSFVAPSDKLYFSPKSFVETERYIVNNLYVENFDGEYRVYLNGVEKGVVSCDVESGELLCH